MAQGDVIAILEKYKKPLTTKEIKEKIEEDLGKDITANTVCANINAAFKWTDPKIIKFYPNHENKPYYVLEKHATQLEKIYEV